MDYREDSPEILLDFLSYHETIKRLLPADGGRILSGPAEFFSAI